MEHARNGDHSGGKNSDSGSVIRDGYLNQNRIAGLCPEGAERTICMLKLWSGEEYLGYSFGAEVDSIAGECVFQTGMVGYVEALTDPSYCGQILVFTNPLFGNYGVPDSNTEDKDVAGISAYFESAKIQVSGVVVGNYYEDYSHYLAVRSVSEWLKEHNIPAIYGVDTRALVKRLRDDGTVSAKMLFPRHVIGKNDCGSGDPLDSRSQEYFYNTPWRDISKENLVAKVSRTETMIYTNRDPSKQIYKPNGEPLYILAVDFGMKNNQIRSMVKLGAKLKVVNYDYDFVSDDDYDGLFLSNGPGDPKILVSVIDRLDRQMKNTKHVVPIFGICLGHQLLALATGAETQPMKYGNRGCNIPAVNKFTKKCLITSQNHGYAVVGDTLGPEWDALFYNANDKSNEGIRHKTLPFYSVQFHPESCPGPTDASYMFSDFLKVVMASAVDGLIAPFPIEEVADRVSPQLPKKILLLGSGALSIGQAGEFDYSGSQAIKAFKEEGIYVVLINPNIATIQTSKGLADKIFFLPITAEFVLKVIEYESPDAICISFGGQTALNVAISIEKELEKRNIRVLGSPLSSIKMTEDRELFAMKMHNIGEKCARSRTASSVEEALSVCDEIGCPLIVRAAYALGGFGSGFAESKEELRSICSKAFCNSPQVIIENSLKGWKEIEYDVLRDAVDNVVVVCNMENVDPLGIHTGDSIVVAPSQTLSNSDYMMLREASIKIARASGIVGECNIQFALDPESQEYCVIEINARLSRSSALASKATGYPIAFVAAKLSLGIALTDVVNSVTKKTMACFEPSLDYCVVKMPRWDLNKFTRVDTKITSCMKSVGEVLSIGRNFEETIQKAIREVDYNVVGFSTLSDVKNIEEELRNPSYLRLFVIANAFSKGYTIDSIRKLTMIDKWFLNRLKSIYDSFTALSNSFTIYNIPPGLLSQAKKLGFSDKHIALCLKSTELAVRTLRIDHGIVPYVKQIDTVAGEFPAMTNYLYMTYNASEHDVQFDERAVITLGSGVYRIGSSVEFDWCAVRCIQTLREMGSKTIIVNYNPETVSTDYDVADRLYLEDICLERIMDIYELENSLGIIISMGGQIPNNLALALKRQNIKILGTAPDMIDVAENRYKFSRLLDSNNVDQPRWKELSSLEEAERFCNEVGYPVLVRPSYVLSGVAMNVVYTHGDLSSYLNIAVKVSPEHPVVISKFIDEAKEIEVDAVAMNGKIITSVISEHVENAGVHSGDATLVLPPQDLDPETVSKIHAATSKIGHALNITGPFNIQFIAKNNEIKVIECNARASRSFPLISKALGINLVEIATNVIMGNAVHGTEPYLQKGVVVVKVPQFSFSRLAGADPILGVEMASTGEVACFGKDKYEAYLKALLSTGFVLPQKNILISIGSYKEKAEFLPYAMKLHKMNYNIFATSGTTDFLQQHGVPAKYLEIVEHGGSTAQKNEYSLVKHIEDNLIDLYINLPSRNRFRRPASYITKGYLSRRMAVDHSIPLITNVKCAKYFVEAISRHKNLEVSNYDYHTSHATTLLPGQILVLSPNDARNITSVEKLDNIMKSAVLQGFVCVCGLPYELVLRKTSLASGCPKQPQAESIHNTGFACDYVTGIHISSFATLLEEDSVCHNNYKILAICSSFDLKKYVSSVKKCFAAIPNDKIIVIDAGNPDLSIAIYMASVCGKSIHVSCVHTKEVIELIKICREYYSQITCDTRINHLYNRRYVHKVKSEEKINASAGSYLESDISQEDFDALFDNISEINCLSVSPEDFLHSNFNTTGASSAPLNVSYESKRKIPDLIPAIISFSEVTGTTIEEIEDRLYDAPLKLFGITHQSDTFLEVNIDCSSTNYFDTPTKKKNPPSVTYIHRAILRDKIILLDGKYTPENHGIQIAPIHMGKESLSTLDSPVEQYPRQLYTPTKDTLVIQALPSTTLFYTPANVNYTSSTLATPASSTPFRLVGNQSQQLFEHKDVESPNPFFRRGSQTQKFYQPLPSASSTFPKSALQINRRGEVPKVADESLYGTNAEPLPRGDIPTGSSRDMSLVPSEENLKPNLLLINESKYLKTAYSLVGSHVLSASQFFHTHLHYIFALAQNVRTFVGQYTSSRPLAGKMMSLAFFEPSTRTECSFEVAFKKLGGDVIKINPTTSSIAKGEDLIDTVRTLHQYSDVIVLRHPSKGAAVCASKYCKIPLINAGDGSGEHPTQALTDAFTIREECGKINGLVILLVGDLLNGRTVHSLVKVLCNYEVSFIYISPEGLNIPDDVRQYVSVKGRSQMEMDSLEDAIPFGDVIYMTRVQKERLSSPKVYERYVNSYRLTSVIMQRAKPKAVVLHPFPRLTEIDRDIDYDERAVYFRQMQHGLYLRMALLLAIFGVTDN